MAVKVEVVSTAKDALLLWLSALPDPFDAAAGRDAADRALADARAVLINIKGRFAGTVPPAPWPATPEIEKTIKNVQIARDFFDTMIDHQTAKPLFWSQTTDKVGPTFVGLARQLYGQLADLEERAAAAPALPDLLKLIPSPPEAWRALPTVVMLALAFVAWSNWQKIRHAFEAA